MPDTDAPNDTGGSHAPSKRLPIVPPPPPPSYSRVPAVLRPPRPVPIAPLRTAPTPVPPTDVPTKEEWIPSGDRPSLAPTVEVQGLDGSAEEAMSVDESELMEAEETEEAQTEASSLSEGTEGTEPETAENGANGHKSGLPSSFPVAADVTYIPDGMFDGAPDNRDRASQHTTGLSAMSQLKRDDFLQRIRNAVGIAVPDARLQPLGILENAKLVLADEKWLPNEKDMRTVIVLTLRALEPITYDKPEARENMRTGDFGSLAHVFLQTLGEKKFFALKRNLERRKQALDKKQSRG